MIALDESVTIKNSEVASYDYKQLFIITEDGEAVEVLDSFIDSSSMKNETGPYQVICTYKGKSAQVNIQIESNYTIDLATELVTVEVDEAMTYDYRSLFTASIDGVSTSITSQMIFTDVDDKVGTYTYTVKLGNLSKSLIINVVEEHLYLVKAKVDLVTLTENEVANYDYKQLFTISKNGKPVEVLDQYLDSTVIAEVGSYIIECSYEGKKALVRVNVVNSIYLIEALSEEINVKVSDAFSYDFKSLFEASIDGTSIIVSDEMVTTNLKDEIGTYFYSVELGTAKKTIIINIIHDSGVIVSAKNLEVTIKTYQVTNYDYKQLFVIEKEEDVIEVLDSYIDKSEVKAEAGSYLVTCNYNDISATVIVHVELPVENIELVSERVDIKIRDALSFDYKSLFDASIDGENILITDEMVETNLKAELGTYTYTVNLETISKSIIINIVENYIIEAVETYPNIEIEIGELDSFDYTILFSLYVEDNFTPVTFDMLDTSELESAEVNMTYNIKLNYSIDDTRYEKIAQVKVVADSEVFVTSIDIETYPNGEYIDLTTLFSITKGKEVIPVTLDMITGTIDYSKPGDNIITLSYDGTIKTANVEVKLGVIIDYVKGDTIQIIKGTNQLAYSFTNDFEVLINGVRFENLPESYILPHEVDFNTVGTYEVTIEIPYNNKNLGLGGVRFDYYLKTITYEVVENKGNIIVLEELVNLPQDAIDYNVYKNLNVTINGKKQTLTETKEYVDVITCYVETLSEPIDFNKIGKQEVMIAVYINGPAQDPEIVTYDVITYSEIVITKNIPVIFQGDVLYTKDLFTIKNGNQEIEVTYDMITGKIDSFKPGVYTITLNYLDLEEEARVVVFDENLKGVYRTNIPIIPVEKDDDEYDDGEGPIYYSMGIIQKPRLLINEDGSMYYGTIPVEIVRAIDESSMIVMIRNTEYIFIYDNGIIFLEPINTINFRFSEERRPLLYFNSSQWELVDHVLINEVDSYVLGNTYLCYSINTFQVKSKLDNTISWYGLKIELLDKPMSNYFYDVSWGVVEYDSDFIIEEGNSSSLVYQDCRYDFMMLSEEAGKIKINLPERNYANMIFRGTVDGKAAELRANQYEGFTFIIDSKIIFNVGSSFVSGMKNGGVDYATNTIFLYNETEMYSYKFIVDPVALTFTLVERDQYYGKYLADGIFVFLDGYGTGIINFDTSSGRKSLFDYSVKNTIIELRYKDLITRNNYGEYSTLYVDPFLNVITFKYSKVKRLEGVRLENAIVQDGAIIKIKSYKIGKDSDSVARAKLYSNIEIITKDGIIPDDQKASFFDTSKIRFNTPGFYQFTIKVNIGGVVVSSYYGVEILDNTYEDHELVATYGNGVISSANSLSINKYGQVTFVSNGVLYNGVIINSTENSFVISAQSKAKERITLVISSIAPEIVLVTCSGAINLTDYYTTRTVRVSGTDKYILREFASSDQVTYILSYSLSSIGEIVSLESINGISPSVIGSIIKITANDKVTYAKIVDWNSATKGLQLADPYRGNYTFEDKDTLTLDGFGGAVLGSTNGSYTLNDNIATITFGNVVKVYRINTNDDTYEIVDIQLDESLVRGYTFNGSHDFYCGSFRYTAETSFSFGENGIVIIKSTSSSHDEGDGQCSSDYYNPSYASRNGVEGVYTVIGNKIRINVNEETFEFLISDVLKVNKISCISTTLNNSNHGYFSINTSFNR